MKKSENRLIILRIISILNVAFICPFIYSFICPALFWSTVNISIIICPILLSKVPNEVSRQAGFSVAYNFGVTTL